MAGACVDEDIAAGVGGHAGCFAERNGVGEFQKIRKSGEGDFRRGSLRGQDERGEERCCEKGLAEVSHGFLSGVLTSQRPAPQ